MTKTFTLKTFWITTLVLSSILLVIVYVLQAGALTREEYLLQGYEQRLAVLTKNNNFLDIDFSKMNSLSNIEKYLIHGNFVKADQVKYIQISDGSVAAK